MVDIMKTRKDTYYFDTYDSARDWAVYNSWPITRIIEYSRGYAVQLHPSGPYAGLGIDPQTHHCDWCDAK